MDFFQKTTPNMDGPLQNPSPPQELLFTVVQTAHVEDDAAPPLRTEPWQHLEGVLSLGP